jgi:hypothetical protein
MGLAPTAKSMMTRCHTQQSSPAMDLHRVRTPGCYSRSRQVRATPRVQGQRGPSVALLALDYLSSRCPPIW